MKSFLRSFAGGEITPELFGRLDLAKNVTGLQRCRNFQVLAHGPTVNRAGWEFIIETRNSLKRSVLIPFIYSTDQAYILEIGDQYVQIHTNGGTVLEASQSITSISKANPGVVGKVAHGYVNGDLVFITATGMTQINGRFFKVASAAADAYSLTDFGGVPIDTSAYGAFVAGTMARAVVTVSPYLEADLTEIHYAQSADVLTLVHTLYQQRELSRASTISWPLNLLTFSPTTAAPASATAVADPASGTPRTRYKFTAVSADGIEESLPSPPALVSGKAITGATQANPGVLTVVAHGYSVGDGTYIDGVFGMTQLNLTEYTIASAPTVDTVTLQLLDGTPVDTTAFGAYVSGGTLSLTDVINDLTVVGDLNTVTPAAVPGASRYNVYKYKNGIYGYIGQTIGAPFADNNITPDFSQSLPQGADPFVGDGNYPGTVDYFKGRRWFAGTLNNPLNVWATRSGTESNMTYSIPTRDDDRIAIRLTARQNNRVLHLVPLSKQLALTSGAEWQISTANSDLITPSSIDYTAQGIIGANGVQPISAGRSTLYSQARGGRVREMKVSETDINGNFDTNDISILAPHLFDGFTLVSAAYAHSPFKTAWFVRSDGKLLGLTYVPEQQVGAWHWHDTDGFYESVAVIPEGNEDVLYAIIRRTVNGRMVRNLERMHTREMTRLDQAFFVDCGSSFDNSIAATLAPGAGALTVGTTGVVFAAGSAVFAAGDVDRYIHFEYETTDADGLPEYFKSQAVITAYVDSTHVQATIEDAWPDLTLIAAGAWRMTITEIDNLWHLVGKTVVVLGDGGPDPVQVVPATAKITIEPASKGCVGIPYNSDMQTLPIALEIEAFGQDAMKNANQVSLRLSESSGVFAGPSFEELRELAQRSDEPYGRPPNLLNGTQSFNLDPSWDVDASVCIRQANPLPITVCSLVIDTAYGSS